jgi:hypothetical protein
MSILREWRAEVRRALKDEYVAYVKATGIVGYRQAPGNLGAVVGDGSTLRFDGAVERMKRIFALRREGKI